MFKNLSIERPNSYILIISKSRKIYLLALIVQLLFYVFWYSVLWNIFFERGESIIIPKSVEETIAIFKENPIILFSIIFILAPVLFGLPKIIEMANVVINGQSFCLNSLDKTISKNDKFLAYFREVVELRIRRFRRSKNRQEYRLSIVLHNSKKIKIEQSSNFEEICDAADAMADILGVSVVTKD